jgi:hypothetical protein
MDDLQFTITGEQETDILNSFDYHNRLTEDKKRLISSYKAEIDPDDWIEHPLPISYVIINWILLNKKINADDIPGLIKSGVMTKQQIIEQVDNAELLSGVLSSFPRIKNHSGIVVYKGEYCANVDKLKLNKVFTINKFLSTSININVATRFTDFQGKKCIMRITIRKGNNLPFISEIYTPDPNISESEVLLPLGSTLKIKNIFETSINGNAYTIYDCDLIRFGPINTRNLWSNFKLKAEEIYDTYNNIEPLDIGGSLPVKNKNKKSLRKIKKSKKSRNKKNKSKKYIF